MTFAGDHDKVTTTPSDENAAIKERLESIRAAIQAENVSYGELSELESLVEHIDPFDVELLEWAGVSEEDYRKGIGADS